MDFFEHLSPFQVEKHIERAAALVGRDGFLFVNSPMYGTDRVFGTPFPLHLEAWRHESQTSFWRNIPCDAKGWPWDGHLIWAAVPYWEELFTSRGLVRDVEIETAIQKVLSGFFAEYAPPRKAIFVLKWPENERRSAEVSDRLTALVSAVEGLHQPR
jgi:hypothetical protein